MNPKRSMPLQRKLRQRYRRKQCAADRGKPRSPKAGFFFAHGILQCQSL
jgi:hypothetical protein